MLIKHALLALIETLGDKAERLNQKNVSIAIVGENQRFKIYEKEEVGPFLEAIDGMDGIEESVVPMES